MSAKGGKRTLRADRPKRNVGVMIRLLPFAFLLLAGCVGVSGERTLSVREIVENARTLDGQEVTVAGWLESCQPLSCGIFGSAEEVDSDFPYYLGIGRSAWFDSVARKHAPGQIVLRARFRDACISDPSTGIIAACADRSGTLEPLAVIK